MDAVDMDTIIGEEAVTEEDDSGWMLTICCGLVLIVYFVILWYLKITTKRCRSTVDLSGKVAIVTGANQGIGYHTAYDFATRNARVILACRNTEKGEEAAQEIRTETKNQNVVVKKLDLSSLKSVRDFASNFVRSEYRLDILVNNAGVTGLPYRKTEDGLETMYAANHFGPFLLTNLLLDLMKKSAPARIVNLTSVIHSWGKIEFDNLMSEKQFHQYSLYYNTKLANVLFTRELSKRLEGTGVTVNCVHPGTVQTNLLGGFNVIFKIIYFGIGYLFFKTPEDGAQTSIHCAVSEEVEGITGKYFVECKVAKEAPAAQDDGVARKLWEVSERITGLASST